MPYKRNYLAQVIYQLRFDPQLVLEQDSPADYQQRVRGRLPALTEGQEVEVHTQLLPGHKVKTEVRKTRPRWIFATADKSLSLTVTSSMFSLEYTRYESIAATKKDFAFLWGQFQDIYQVETLSRVGLRYVDKVSRPEGDPLDWKGWIAQSLIQATLPMEAPEGHDLSRSMHAIHWTGSDHRITYQFGIFNGGSFPGPVAKREYILDFDCSSIGLVDASEAKDCLVKYQALLSVLFGKSIGPDMEAEMNRDDGGNYTGGESQ